MTKYRISCPKKCRSMEVEDSADLSLGSKYSNISQKITKCPDCSSDYIITEKFEDKDNGEIEIRFSGCFECRKSNAKNIKISKIESQYDEKNFSFKKECPNCKKRTMWVVITDPYAICSSCYIEENNGNRLYIPKGIINDDHFSRDCKKCKRETRWKIGEKQNGSICTKCLSKHSGFIAPFDEIKIRKSDFGNFKEFNHYCENCNGKTTWGNALYLEGKCENCNQTNSALVAESNIKVEKKKFETLCPSCYKISTFDMILKKEKLKQEPMMPRDIGCYECMQGKKGLMLPAQFANLAKGEKFLFKCPNPNCPSHKNKTNKGLSSLVLVN